MIKENVLVMYPTRPGAMAQLEEAYTLHRYDQAEDRTAFLREFGPSCSSVVINGHAALQAEHLDHLPRVGLVACSSAGFESIDTVALREKGIAFTNTSDALYDDVADIAVLLTLACRRQLVRAHDYVASGDWAKNGMYPLLSAVRGKKVGILGLGTIGKAIARRLEPFGVELGYTARSKKAGTPYAFFETPLALAEWSDICIVAIPAGPETVGLVDAAIIDAVGPSGTLINIARGSIIDEAALIDALSSGRLGDAGLDVFVNEPDPNPALTSLPNVTLYPHHASGTTETRDAMAQLVVDNLAAFYAGKPLLTPVYHLETEPRRA